MKQLLDNKIQREFFAFVDTIDGTPTFCGFSNSITQGTITNIVYFAVELKLRERRRNLGHSRRKIPVKASPLRSELNTR